MPVSFVLFINPMIWYVVEGSAGGAGSAGNDRDAGGSAMGRELEGLRFGFED